MCNFNSMSGNWGDETFTISGTGFGTPNSLFSKGTATLVGATTQPKVNSWSDTSIQLQLPALVTDHDGDYTLSVAPIGALVLGTPCTATLTITAPPTMVGTPIRNGNSVILPASSGTFGKAPGQVQVGDQTVIAGPWGESSITIDITGLAAADYAVTITRSNGSTVTTTLTISATVPPPTQLVVAVPDPTDWGARLTFSALGFLFGTPVGGLTDKLTLDDSGTPRSLAVELWTPTEIVATLPLPPSRTYGTRTITIHDGSSAEPTCAIQLQASAGQSTGKLFPEIPWQSVLGLGPGLVVQTELLRSAVATGTKWRYEYLKAEAIRAASQAQAYEANVLQLMQLALAKVVAAEQLLNPVLIEAIQTLQKDVSDIEDLANNADIASAITDLADAAAKALLLEALLVWLIGHDVIEFWIGLFEALIDDVCGFDSDLHHVDQYLHAQFSLLSIAGKSISQLVQDLTASIEQQVDAFASSLRQAASEVVGGTSKAMAEAFDAFDMPLTARLGAPGSPDLLKADPLAAVEQKLIDAVEAVVSLLKTQILAALDAATSALEDLFVDVLKTFVVYPIVAILAVGFALGGFGAAILCALILIAIEELVHLIASWLTGPLLGKLDELKHKITDAVGRVTAILAREASLLTTTSPQFLLDALTAELRAIKDIIPEAFLDELADLIGRARDVVMRGALALATSAEQALGLENATAFDAISLGYRNVLTPALLPGARDPSLFAGASLLRDIGKLEQQRAAIVDGKELVTTFRMSVVELLGGDRARFAEMLMSGQIVVNLREEVLLDRKFPGLYRALIQDIKVRGVFDTGLAALSPAVGIPISLTHGGTSWTRVKRNANPYAPPLTLPSCLANSDQYGSADLVNGILRDAIAAWRRSHPRPQLQSNLSILDDSFLTLVGQPLHKSRQISIEHAWRAWVQYVPSQLAADLAKYCPYADSSIVDAGVRAILETAGRPILDRATADWQLLFMVLFVYSFPLGLGFPPFGPTGPSYTTADLVQAYVAGTGPAAGYVRERLAADSPIRPRATSSVEVSHAIDDARTALFPTLSTLWAAAFASGSAKFGEKVAKWGAATVAADPDSAITSAGFVLLRRDQPPETSVHHLFPDQSNGQLFAVPANTDDIPRLPASTSMQYRPFENRGLAGQLLLAFPALDPSATTSDLLGAPPGSAPALPPVTDLLLEITVRACHDEQLAQTIKSNRARRQSALRTATVGAAEIAGSLPAITRTTGARRTVHFSLRAHRDRTLEAWLLAAAKGIVIPSTTATPLGPSEGFSPLTSLVSGAPFDFSLVLHKDHTFDVSAIADLETTLDVALGDLGVPAIDDQQDLAFREIAVALIPYAGSDPQNPGTIPTSVGTVSFGPELAQIAPATTRKRLLVRTDLASTAQLLASQLADGGTAIDVSIPDPSKLYDVVFSITYELSATRVDVTALGLP